MPAPSVTVVVLSYNRPRFLRLALASLAAQTHPASALEVLVVDNRSAASEEIAAVVAQFPAFRLIANPENSGFTGGMNLGLRMASGDFVYLTEDDIVLDADNVAQLVEYIESDPRAGIVAGVMYDHDTRRVWCAGGHVRLGPTLRLDLPGRGEPDRAQFPHHFEVSYICGATMLAHRDLWRALAGFRDDFFMYQEDVELGLRVLGMGRSLVIVPSARSYHCCPPRGPERAEISFHKFKNLFALYTLHAPARVLPEFFVHNGLLTLARGKSLASPVLHAWAHFATRLPGLLRDRRRLERVRRASGAARAGEQRP
jgi:hypothetical protein